MNFPNQGTQSQLADLFGVSVDYLLGRTDIRNANLSPPAETIVDMPIVGSVRAGMDGNIVSDDTGDTRRIAAAALHGRPDEYFSLELAQKVSRSFYDLRLKGQFLGGKPPYGYKIVDKHYVVNEEQAEKIRYVFSAIEKGAKLKDLARELKHEPCNWYSVVRNIKYAGCLVHRGEVIEDVIPAIITRAQFDRVQAILDAQGNSYRPARNYPLSGKIFCGLCGEKLHGGIGNGRNGKYRYYRRDTTRANGCELRGVNADKVEEAVVKFAFDYLLDEKSAGAFWTR